MADGHDEHGRPILTRGRIRLIVSAVTAQGKTPALDFLDNIDLSELRKFLALFERFAELGSIMNRTQYKKLDGPIWEFKRKPNRLCCFHDGRYVVLTHGFVKKEDRCPKNELLRAKRIMAEDEARRKGGS